MSTNLLNCPGQAKPERQALSVEEAGRILGIGRCCAYEGVKSGDIPSIRIGRRIVVPREALRKMLSGEHVR